VPFLDYRIVEAALALPDRLRVENGVRKVALLRAATGIAPPAVLARRDKVAFQTPQVRWLREALPTFAPLLERSYAEAHGFLRQGAGERLAAAFAGGRIDDASLWRALSVELWLRRVVHGERLELELREAPPTVAASAA
jgi:asparagine synthase (glutamine-hydrolysing)